MSYTSKIKNSLLSEIDDNKQTSIILNNDVNNQVCENCNFKNCNFTNNSKMFYCAKKDAKTNKCNYTAGKSVINSNAKKTYKYLKNIKSFDFIHYLKNNSEYKLLVQELIKQIKDYCSYSSDYYQLNSTDLAQILDCKLTQFNMKVEIDKNNHYVVIDNNLKKVYSIAI